MKQWSTPTHAPLDRRRCVMAFEVARSTEFTRYPRRVASGANPLASALLSGSMGRRTWGIVLAVASIIGWHAITISACRPKFLE